MSEEETEKATLDLSKRQLKKVPKQDDAQNVRVLILDENELQKIDNIDSYLKIERLSLRKNQLLRMYGVCRLHCLRELNLSFNGILSIEGLKDCVHLRQLNLEGNNIKTIEHLNNNIRLEYLNLSDNSIGSISDMSYLKALRELHLHGNRLTHLRLCDKYLPTSLEVLTLGKNQIVDLNEICTLSNLCNLHSITVNENPCVTMTASVDGFDHRPFVLNWCMSVKVIDGFVVDPIESLKAEWLYSQGRGRQFRLGEQSALAKYLSSVCPLIGKALENENERKLRLILSKAQQHQRQLQEEISEHSQNSGNNSPSSGRKKPSSRIQSPRFSRLSGRQGSPESMISSYHGNSSVEQTHANNLVQMTTSLIENIKNESLMSQSFDASLNSVSGVSSSVTTTKTNNSQESTPRTITPNPYNDQSYCNPLTAASKMVPVPETLMSPDVCPAAVAQRVSVSALNTQIHNSKMNKNKDNKMNSPKVRSPHFKQRNNAASPRKGSAHNIMQQQQQQQHQQQQQQQTNHTNNNNHNLHKTASNTSTATYIAGEHNIKAHMSCQSVLVALPDIGSGAGSSDDDSDHIINVDKLKTIRNRAAQRSQQQKELVVAAAANHVLDGAENTESSAVVIQKIWRGYRTRKKTKDIAEKLVKRRTHEYIEKLSKDMEVTRAEMEHERKIQQLQLQAINALWKKVSTMQGQCKDNDSEQTADDADGNAITANNAAEGNAKTLSLDNSSTEVVHDLAKTCTMLTTQVQQLQGSMRDILNCLTLFCNLPQENVKKLLTAGVADALGAEKRDSAGTQTEIVAVHTPQIENASIFPFTKARPSTLPLEAQRGAASAGQQKRSEQIPEQEEFSSALNESSLDSEPQLSVEGDSLVEKADEEKEGVAHE